LAVDAWRDQSFDAESPHVLVIFWYARQEDCICMFLIPYRETSIRSSRSPELIADQLRQVTARRTPWFKSTCGKFDFVGSISSSGFRLSPVERGRNSYLSVLHGRIFSSDAGTEIKIAVGLHPSVIVVILVFFVILPLGLAGFSREFLIYFAAILFPFHCLMYFFGFLPAARKAEDRIRRIAA